MAIYLIGHFLAILIGISLGLLGGGGSILAAPVLIFVMGVPSKTALAMTLVIVGVASVIGIIPHWRNGNVNWRIAAMFAPPAMVGAYLGARIAALPAVSSTLQLLVFIIMMVLASISMIRQGNTIPTAVPAGQMQQRQEQWAIALEGLGVGLLTGFVGIGGGFLVIPALVLLGKIPIKEAVGTSLVILALKAVTGFAGYLGHVPIVWSLMVSFAIAATVGILIGSYINQFVAAKQLEKGFGYFVLAIALWILMQEVAPSMGHS